MKIEFDFGYELEIYEKGNYGTVKRKYFEDMLDLVTFTNKNTRTSIEYIIEVINKTEFKTMYKGCIHTFNRKVDRILMSGDYR